MSGEETQFIPDPYPFGELIQGLTYEQYAIQKGLRASQVKLIKRSPAHLKAAEKKPRVVTDALRIGGIFHSAIENGPKFLETYAIEPIFTGKTKEGKESSRSAEAIKKRDDWYDTLKPGTQVVKAEEYDMLAGMLTAVATHSRLKNMLKGGMRETSLWVKDPETGLTLQCRPDFISEAGYMLDFKSTRDAGRNFFLQEVFNLRDHRRPQYIIQAAHYAHCARLAGLQSPNSFTFVAVEKEPPYGIMIYPMDIGCLGPGEQWRAQLTRTYANCLESGKWPSYPETIFPVSPPEWIDLPPDDEDGA